MTELSEKKKGMAEPNKKKITTEILLENISTENCWAITSKVLTNFVNLRGDKITPPLLGIGEGVIAPVLGWEKWVEIQVKIWGDGSKLMAPMIKENFNIPVRDAAEAAKFYIAVATLLVGPEFIAEVVEESRERAVWRISKCSWWERYKELKIAPEFVVCPEAHQSFAGEGIKTVNPKIMYKLLKAMPRGDPYCEGVFEFKEV